MPPNCHPHIRRATTSVLVAVALLSGGILLLGDRFHVTSGYALTQPLRLTASMVACVADENMRLINPDQEQCRPDEVELLSGRSGPKPVSAVPALSGPAGPPGPPGPPGRSGADGISGFEIVTAKVAVPSRQSASGEARCPAGKVALGGGVLPDPEVPRKEEAHEERRDVVVSAPLLPGGDAGYGWAATVKNTGTGALPVVVAVICVTMR